MKAKAMEYGEKIHIWGKDMGSSCNAYVYPVSNSCKHILLSLA